MTMDRIQLRDVIARTIRAGGRVSGDEHVANIVRKLLPEFEKERALGRDEGREEGRISTESKVCELLDEWNALGHGDGIHGKQLRKRVLGADDFHEEDEPVKEVVAALDRGVKGVTRAQVRRSEGRDTDVREDLMDAANDDAHWQHGKALEILGDL